MSRNHDKRISGRGVFFQVLIGCTAVVVIAIFISLYTLVRMGSYDVPVRGGYFLYKPGSKQAVILAPGNIHREECVNANVSKLGMANELIVGLVESVNGPVAEEQPGWFVIDTASRFVQKGLSLKDAEGVFQKKGYKFPRIMSADIWAVWGM